MRGPAFAVAIYDVVDGAAVVLFEYGDVDDFRFAFLGFRAFGFADKHLLLHAHGFVRTIAIEDDDVVDGRAVLHELILFQARAHETFGSVDIEFFVGFDDLGGFDGVEGAEFGAAGMVGGIFVVEQAVPVARHLRHVCQVGIDACDFLLHTCDEFVGFFLIEFEDAGHLDFHQAEDVVARHFANHLRVEGRQALVDVGAGGLHVFGVLKAAVFVDALLDKYLFERGKVERLHKFAAADFQFAAQEVAGVVNGGAEHIADTEEAGFLVVDDAAVGRDGDLAIRECVKRIDGLVAARARREMDNDFHVGRCHILHFANLYFTLLAGADDAVNEGHDVLAEGNFGDDQRLVVQFLNLRTHLDRTAAHTVVVFRHIDGAARLEIGIEAEVLALQIGNGGLAEFAKVVGKNLCAQTHGNAFCALGQQERELHGQGHRFAVAAVVGEFPLRSLGVEEDVEGKFRQACLDVTRGSGRRARQDITPVSLAVNEQILLAQLHEGIADGGIAVGVKLHGMAHDVGHLIIAAIVQALHGM